MVTYLYMAITANGLVAAKKGDTSWVSSSDWDNFRALAQDAGNMIIGRNTYEAMLEEGTFPVEGCLNVVMTSSMPSKEEGQVVFTDKSPAEVLEMLDDRGFERAFIAGGAKIAASFMKEGLVDELYLTVHPIAFGEGVKLFNEPDFKAELDLDDVTRLSKNEIQLHYKVINNR